MKTPRHFAASLCAAALAGCAAPYQPYAGGDAAKVRIALGQAGVFSSVAGNLRTITDGKCSAPVRLPQLFPYAEPSTATVRKDGRSDTGPSLYPRAGMVGSPDPTRSDVVELQLPAGRYQFALFGSLGPSICGMGVELHLERSGQYEIDIGIDGLARQCRAQTKRLDMPTAAQAQWRSTPMLPATPCST
ncbi:hypothetical protein [Ideonella sp. BN130291]|uniref:hypothetical protein n=1 Tax=Ideonella sp. BN130291 TaxID=3112940 RepID=UPI002E270BC7|nr:hypothetical protein [Ideonella sp. BN130291]